MWVVSWKSLHTGQLCEWASWDERDARSLADILISVGVVASLEHLPEPPEPIADLEAFFESSQAEAWTAEEIMAREG